MSFLFRLKPWLYCLVAVLLTACRGNNPVNDTLLTLIPKGDSLSIYKPGFEYLAVSIDGRDTAMALGQRTFKDHEASGRVHEHWYTGQGEMLYLVDGRIQQALGFTHEWRGQTSTPPIWSTVLQSSREISWRRVLDVMPGYRFNLTDDISSYKTAAPKRLPEGVSQQAQWTADLVASKSDDGQAWWYLQKFAVLDGRVIYSEQCVAKAMCFALRPLGVLVPAK